MSEFDVDKFFDALDICTRDGTLEDDPLAIAFCYYYDHRRTAKICMKLGAKIYSIWRNLFR